MKGPGTIVQRMRAYAAGKGQDKSRGLILVSVSGYVRSEFDLVIPKNGNLMSSLYP